MNLKNIIGNLPEKSDSFIRRMRFHQGWWRAFVLDMPPGEYINPRKEIATVCNRINEGDKSNVNFLNNTIISVVKGQLDSRGSNSKGMVEQVRLYNNLLSSQPLAFNYFGYLANNLDLATRFIKTIIPEISAVNEIVFEFAPNSSQDSSAFDIGMFVSKGKEKGFIGLECKYTDPFSFKNSKGVFYGSKESNKYEYYREVFEKNKWSFKEEYDYYVLSPDYNQLFRNEVLGKLLLDELDFVYTGIFCHEDDEKTINAANLFKGSLSQETFVIITYFDFIDKIQRLQLSKEEREWTMMLWARYSGELSKRIYN